MSVWKELREKSIGKSVRQEVLDEQIITLKLNILNKVTLYNNLVKDIEALAIQCNSYDPNPGTYIFKLFDATIVNETLKTHDYEKLSALSKTLDSGIARLQSKKITFESSLSSLKQAAGLRQMFEKHKREQMMAQEALERQKKIDESNKRITVKFILALLFTAAVTALSIFAFVHFHYNWWSGLIIGIATMCLSIYFIGESEDF